MRSEKSEPLLPNPGRALDLQHAQNRRRPPLQQPWGVKCCDSCCGEDDDASKSGNALRTLDVYQWVILLLLNAIGPFASDAYLPSLPEIECDLNTSAAAASATIQLNWIVLGLMNPVIGVLSDRYGRKNITALFLAVFVAGAIGCAYAPTLPQLMIYRLVMGVGQAVSVIASAVVRDLVDDPGERMRITSIFNTLQPLMIVGAPLLGGLVAQLFQPQGWRDLFKILAGWGFMTMVLVGCFVPESNHAYLARRSQLPSSPRDLEQERLESRSLYAKVCEMLSSVRFTALTLSAAVFMGGVRSMLCAPFPFPRRTSCSRIAAAESWL